MEEEMGMGQVDEMDEEMNADMDGYGVSLRFYIKPQGFNVFRIFQKI